MPNIATAFKEEISRLCRKEMRKHLEPLRKASTAYRKEIAALKRKLQESERRVGALTKRGGRSQADTTETSPEKRTRFVPKGLKSLRVRLGLSAVELAGLLGVTGQSIYNWEQKKSTPRAAQLAQLAELRELGKKEVRAKLDAAAGEKPARGRKARQAVVADKPVRARRKRRAQPVADAAQ
ncbi:MAG: helix-turn-helix transcriptional regulator [Rhodanobacteraceae bacterium]|nr:helix-turn-helix transcriptional regulator [Rhodanobacteraceae bacterium]